MTDDTLDSKDMIESSDEFEAVYRSYAGNVYRFLLWRTRDPHLSEDLTSNVFEKAWRARASFRGGSVAAWLQRIARNALTDHWRKRQELAMEDPELAVDETEISEQAVAEALDRELLRARLLQALDALPRDMRAVVMARFIEGLNCRQTAAKLNLTEANVRVIQYRALKKMRGRLR